MTIITIITLGTVVFAAQTNSISDFFSISERQLEAKSQCRELRAALNDILNEKRPVLEKKRYKDYQGKIDQWSITELLSKYYVSPNGLPKEKEFYRDYRKKPARLAVKSQIAQLGDCNSYAGD